jgi:hypothetical protein
LLGRRIASATGQVPNSVWETRQLLTMFLVAFAFTNAAWILNCVWFYIFVPDENLYVNAIFISFKLLDHQVIRASFIFCDSKGMESVHPF